MICKLDYPCPIVEQAEASLRTIKKLRRVFMVAPNGWTLLSL